MKRRILTALACGFALSLLPATAAAQRPSSRPSAAPRPAAPRPAAPRATPRPSAPVRATPRPAAPVRATPRPTAPVRAAPRPSAPVRATPRATRPQYQPRPATPSPGSRTTLPPRSITPAPVRPGRQAATPVRGTPDLRTPGQTSDRYRPSAPSRARPSGATVGGTPGTGDPAARPGAPRAAVGGGVRVVERGRYEPTRVRIGDLRGSDQDARPANPVTDRYRPRTRTRIERDSAGISPSAVSGARPADARPVRPGGSTTAVVGRYDPARTGAARPTGRPAAGARPGTRTTAGPRTGATAVAGTNAVAGLVPRTQFGARTAPGSRTAPPATAPRLVPRGAARGVTRPVHTTASLVRTSCFSPVWDPCYGWNDCWSPSWSCGLSWSIGINYGSFCWGWSSWYPWHCYRTWNYYCGLPSYCWPGSSIWWWPSTTYVPIYLQASYAPPSTVTVAESTEAPAAEPAPPRELTPVEQARKFVDLGDFYFREGRFGEAAEAYGRARSLAPDDATIHFVMADAVFASGDYHFAAFLIGEALRLDPALATAATDKRLFYGDVAVFERQMETLVRYLEDKPYDAMAHLVLGYNLKFSGKPAEAEKAFRRVLEIDPHDEAARLLLAALSEPAKPAPGEEGPPREEAGPAEEGKAPVEEPAKEAVKEAGKGAPGGEKV